MSAPTAPPSGSAPPAPASAPPSPSPAAAPGSEGEARATAAAWVAAVGALLLLAAAAAFLAVSWDTLGLAARVAVVGAATAAAVLGGHRLRRTLPAVGSVVFHLGSLLLPVDAFGLALQLDLDVAARLVAAGGVAVTALPLLAAAGRSRALGWTAVAGVPVLATGLGAMGALPAPLLVAAAALALAAAARPPVGHGRRTRTPAPSSRRLVEVAGSAAAALAVTAVHLPLVAVVGWAAGLPVVAHLAAAGWLPRAWTVPALTGGVAVTALVTVASRRRSGRLAVLTVTTAAASLLVALLPPTTPRLVLVLAPAVGVLAVQLAALSVPPAEPLWGRSLRAAATATEAAAVVAVLAALTAVLLPPRPTPDRDAALAAAVLALAAGVAVARRLVAGRGSSIEVAPLAAGAGVFAAAALALGVPAIGPVPVAAAVLVAALALAVLPTAPAPAALTAVAMAGLAATSTVWRPGATSIAVGATLVIAVHLRLLLHRDAERAVEVVAVGLPVALVVATLAAAPERTPLLGSGGLGGLLPTDPVAVTAVIVALAVLAAALAPLRLASNGVLLAVALVGLLAVPAGTAVGTAATPGQAAVLGLVGGGPGAVVPAAVACLAIAATAWTRRDDVGLALAVPAGLRAVVTGSLALGASHGLVGLLLLVVAGGGVVVAAGGARWPRLAAFVAAIVAAPLGWDLVGDEPLLRAAGTVGAGLVVTTLGVVHRRAGVAHLGGGLTTLGIWQALALLEVHLVDVWLLPVAAQVAVAGARSRRTSGTSSWIADVPAIGLVVVPALAERLAGGSGWHAVLAGAAAAAAVVAGGAWRLGGPLVAGTLALVALVLVELFAVVAVVPTWAWLAAGGAMLLAAAAMIERSGGSPGAAARRLREVVADRFG